MNTERIIDYFSKERFTIATSILRIIFGIIILYNYMILYSQRHLLFTDNGYTTFGSTLSLYDISNSTIYFDVVYNIGIVVAILYTLGIKGRLSSILNFIFYYSLYIRFYHIGDGGDNLMIIALFFLIFADCTKYFSFDQNNKNRKSRQPNSRKFTSILHNFSVFFIIAQVIIVYMVSATYQLMGETWSSGTALYYISQVQTMSSPIFEKLATGSLVYLGVILTYASIFVKYAFAFMIFNKKAKIFIVSCICMFHIGIGVSMHLYTFSLIMIAVEALLFTNEEYYSFYNKLQKTGIKIKERLLAYTNAFSKRHLQNYKLIVFYDGWCGLCLTTVSKLQRLDWFDLITYVDFRDSSNIKNESLNLNELEKRMHSLNPKNGKIQNGVDSFTDLTKRIIPLWFLTPILYLSKWLGIGNMIYDFIAKRRNLVPVNKCINNVCSREDAKVGD